jgi:hypothetical protein
MVEKIRKGYEGAEKKKIKEEYGSTLGAASKRARRRRKTITDRSSLTR